MDSTSEAELKDKLIKEAESLKMRLDDERQKLNDMTRNYSIFDKLFIMLDLSSSFLNNCFYILVASIADRLEVMNCVNVKPRRILKGHQAKVLCADWSPDKRHIVSSSQVISFNLSYCRSFYSIISNIFVIGW